MCPKRHLFTSYQSYDGGKIIIGNNTGIGFIRLKMSNGIVRELSEISLVSCNLVH